MKSFAERLKLSFADICEAAGESPNVVYDAIREGHLETFLVGRRRFARPEKVRAWIDFLEAESNAGRPVVYRARSRERPPSARGRRETTDGANAPAKRPRESRDRV